MSNQSNKESRKTTKIILALGCAALAVVSTIANLIYKWPITDAQKIAQIGVFMVLTIYFLHDASQDTRETADEPAEETPAKEVSSDSKE